MALSEIQKDVMTKAQLYAKVRTIVTELDNTFEKLTNRLEFLNLITSPDMNEIGVDSATQTLLANMRTELNGLITSYNTSFADIADQIRVI